MTSIIKQISKLTSKEYIELQNSFKNHLKESKIIKYNKDRLKIFKYKSKKQPSLFIKDYRREIELQENHLFNIQKEI